MVFYTSLILTYVLLVAAFALVFAALTESKHKKRLRDISKVNKSDIEGEEYLKKRFDLRGTIRKRFGLIASLHNSNENSLCSPVSALMPLGKLALGAEGSTLKELHQAIGIPAECHDCNRTDSHHWGYTGVKKHLSDLITELRNVTRPYLDVASRIYVSKDKLLIQGFVKEATAVFRSAIQKVDFSKSDTLAGKINGWVSSQTHEMISDIISPKDMSPESSLVIVNAIYFAGTWIHSFSSPTPKPFYTQRGEKKVSMMENGNWYNYTFSNKLHAELVEIPYAQQNMSMLLVVPKETYGLQNLTKHLKNYPEHLAEAIEEMNRQYIRLTIPSFRMESHWDLKALYREAGLTSIFNKQNSGLTRFIHNGDLHVSTAIQKAVIDVHEHGKIMSIMTIIGTSMSKRITVTADHPFLFYIKHHSQQVLMGTFC